MVDRLLSVKSALGRVLQELEWDDLAISEWKILEALRCLVHPFAQFTSLVSGEDFTTISAVLPAIMDLNLHLEEVVDLEYDTYVHNSDFHFTFQHSTIDELSSGSTCRCLFKEAASRTKKAVQKIYRPK